MGTNHPNPYAGISVPVVHPSVYRETSAGKLWVVMAGALGTPRRGRESCKGYEKREAQERSRDRTSGGSSIGAKSCVGKR